MKNRKKLTGARAVGLLRYLPLILWVAFFVFAFGWIVLASFSTTKEIFSNGLLQSGVHVENYTGVWERNHVAHYFVNSLITTGIPCVLIILIAAPAAYVLSKKTFFGRKQTFNAFVVGMSIPQVMLVIPIYCWFVKANLVGHLSTLVILYTTLNLPYTVYFLTAFFSTVPTALAEAAMIDGCNPIQTYFKVVFPILRPTMVSVGILEAMWVWNDYLLPTLVLDIKKYRTIPMLIQYFRGSYGRVEMGPMMACIMLTVLPIIILYLACQKYIIEGVVAGAVKG